MSMEVPIRPALRRALFSVWGGKCGATAEHVDHLQRKSKGGRDRLDNYFPACSRCNLGKSALEIEDQYLGLLKARISSRVPKVLAALGELPRKHETHLVHTVRVDMNISMSAIKWTARQRDEPWSPFDHGTSMPIVTGLTCLEPGRNKEAWLAYSKVVPVWDNPYRQMPLVPKGVSRGFPTLMAEAQLIRLARIAVVMETASFEFDGPLPPKFADHCRPCPEGGGLLTPRGALEFFARSPHNLPLPR